MVRVVDPVTVEGAMIASEQGCDEDASVLRAGWNQVLKGECET